MFEELLSIDPLFIWRDDFHFDLPPAPLQGLPVPIEKQIQTLWTFDGAATVLHLQTRKNKKRRRRRSQSVLFIDTTTALAKTELHYLPRCNFTFPLAFSLSLSLSLSLCPDMIHSYLPNPSHIPGRTCGFQRGIHLSLLRWCPADREETKERRLLSKPVEVAF